MGYDMIHPVPQNGYPSLALSILISQFVLTNKALEEMAGELLGMPLSFSRSRLP